MSQVSTALILDTLPIIMYNVKCMMEISQYCKFPEQQPKQFLIIVSIIMAEVLASYLALIICTIYQILEPCNT